MSKTKDDSQNGVPGIAVDSRTGAYIDPTPNVLALVEAANRRQDDLRNLTKELYDSKNACQKEIGALREKNQEKIALLREQFQEKIASLREKHQEQLAQQRETHQEKMMGAEAGRLDSIRQVDREEVAKTAITANTAITTLAKQTTDLQQTLAKQVTDTAAAQESRNSAQYSDTNKRLSALENASSEGKGKQGVADPQLDKLVMVVENLVRAQATGTGKSAGSTAMWGYVVGGIGLLIAIGTFFMAVIGTAMAIWAFAK